jgi:hypothetical protein
MADDELEKRLARLRHRYGLEYEMVRAMAAFEHANLRPLFFLNGGALIAFFTLYGALSRTGPKPPAFDHPFMMGALVGWILGLLLAMLAANFGAHSQFAFRKLRSTETELEEFKIGLPVDRSETALNRAIGGFQSTGRNSRRISVALGFASLGAFVIAISCAFASLPS